MPWPSWELIRLAVEIEGSPAIMGLGKPTSPVMDCNGDNIDSISNRSDTNVTALVFDKRYYEAAHNNAWRPRINPNPTTNDFTCGKLTDGGNIRMMLKTDLCLTMDVRNVDTQPCCSNNNMWYPHLENKCLSRMRRCPMYPDLHPWMEAGTVFLFALVGALSSYEISFSSS